MIFWYCVCSLVDFNDILEYFYDVRKCEGFIDWNGLFVCKIIDSLLMIYEISDFDINE